MPAYSYPPNIMLMSWCPGDVCDPCALRCSYKYDPPPGVVSGIGSALRPTGNTIINGSFTQMLGFPLVPYTFTEMVGVVWHYFIDKKYFYSNQIGLCSENPVMMWTQGWGGLPGVGLYGEHYLEPYLYMDGVSAAQPPDDSFPVTVTAPGVSLAGICPRDTRGGLSPYGPYYGVNGFAAGFFGFGPWTKTKPDYNYPGDAGPWFKGINFGTDYSEGIPDSGIAFDVTIMLGGSGYFHPLFGVPGPFWGLYTNPTYVP